MPRPPVPPPPPFASLRSIPPPLPPSVSPPLPARPVRLPPPSRSPRRPPPRFSYRRRPGWWERIPDRFRGPAVSVAAHGLAILVMALILLPGDPPHQVLSATLDFAAEEPAPLEVAGLDIDAAPDEPAETPAAVPDDPPLAAAEEIAETIPPVAGPSDAPAVAAPPAGKPNGGGNGGGDEGRLAGAGAKTGAIQVSLFWDNTNDLDLHVLTPTGEEIFFSHRRSAEGGELDVDRNVNGETREAIENVYFPASAVRPGRYVVAVDHYRNHGSPDPTPFRVRVVVDGKETRLRPQSIRYGQPGRVVHRFLYRPPKDDAAAP